MIHDVDGSLRSLLTRSFPDKAPAIAFDAPTAEWAAAQRGPALSFFLYDIREDLDGRAADWDDVRDERGRVIGRQPPPRRYQLSYLVTAWGNKSAEAEHELLSTVLRSVPERELIPDEDLQGSLAGITAPVLVRVGIPTAGAGAQGWELLSALGVPPRASLEFVVLAPLFAPMVTDIAPPAEEIKLGLSREDGGVKKERGFPYPPSPAPVVPAAEAESGNGSDEKSDSAATPAAAARKGGATGPGKRTGKVTEPAPAAGPKPMGGGHDWTKVKIVERVNKPDESLEG